MFIAFMYLVKNFLDFPAKTNRSKCKKSKNKVVKGNRNDDYGVIEEVVVTSHKVEGMMTRDSFYSSSIMQDSCDFIQDDYWTSSHEAPSQTGGILSTLRESYNYEDSLAALDLDVNLAQVDMEDFRTEDIRSFLRSLPPMCASDMDYDHGVRVEMFASISSSTLAKYQCGNSGSSSYIYNDKSEIQFSPVKDAPLVNFSVDSLDCGGASRGAGDIILTCRANKDNYTIAFEGSAIMDKSAASFQDRRSLSPYTTWGKLHKESSGDSLTQITRSTLVTRNVERMDGQMKFCSLPDFGLDLACNPVSVFIPIYDLSKSACQGRRLRRYKNTTDLIKKFIDQKRTSEECMLEDDCSIIHLSGGTDRSIQTSTVAALSDSISSYENTKAKPIYVMYPNYTLPDLSFLKQCTPHLHLKNIFLWPQKFSPTMEEIPPFSPIVEQGETPSLEKAGSFLDAESLKNKDFKHIKDWDSLLFLLPKEHQRVLMENLDVRNLFGQEEACFAQSLLMEKVEPDKTEVTAASPPSSGFRGSSTILDSDQASPLPTCSSIRCKRPPVPRSILRNPVLQNIKSKRNKRYSMFELRRIQNACVFQKRRSLPPTLNCGLDLGKKAGEREYCSEDEGVESAGSHCCDSPGPQNESDIKKLDMLLKSGMQWEEYGCQTGDNGFGESNRKAVSFQTPPNSPSGLLKSPYQVKFQPSFNSAIHEECEFPKHVCCDHASPTAMFQWTDSYNYKKDLIDAVVNATTSLRGEENDKISDAALNTLCPALYAVLNHGLKPHLDTTFGKIGNSVWQVVEASAQQGPMTTALHDLVLKLNNEDVLTEGIMKFNAFIFGLLNVKGLDTWFTYLRMRESILKKHYMDHGVLLGATRSVSDRQLTDQLLSELKPLGNLHFNLDLLYECRQLHKGFAQLTSNPGAAYRTGNRTSWVLKKIVRSLQNAEKNGEDMDITNDACNSCGGKARPRSCVDSSSSNGYLGDIAGTVRRRWSGIQFGSKLASAFERLATDGEEEAQPEAEKGKVEEVTSSQCEVKFKHLQRKWERLSVRDGRTMSRIPRPVTSPIGRPPPPSSLRFSTTTRKSPASPRKIPTSPAIFTDRKWAPTGGIRTSLTEESKFSKSKIASLRSSRMDLQSSSTALTRPFSALPRSTLTMKQPYTHSNNYKLAECVRTLGHRLPSDNGHLTFNDGEILRIVLEVDDKWLLCCRGEQKGLVPRASVLPISNRK